VFAVTLPPSAAHDPVRYAQRAQKAGANLLEVRGDRTPEIERFDSPLPLIVALRGGDPHLIDRLHPAYVDVELQESVDLPAGISIIRSFHDYERTPDFEHCKTIADELRATNADIIKIVTTINSYRDITTLQKLHAYLPENQKRVILGMGTRAHMLRMLSPLRNAITYTYLDEGEAAADGQVPLHMYQQTAQCRNPRIFGILGNLDIQSQSPLIHNTFFHARNMDALFTTFLTDDLDDAWNFITTNAVEGLAVTSPWKQKILPYLQGVDPLAQDLQSVNTVVAENGAYRGYNKDVDGFRDGYSFVKNAEFVSILGSGGVVPAIIHACRELDIQNICLYARNADARKKLQEHFGMQTAEISAVRESAPDVLICTINADVSVELPQAKKGACAIDVRYGKRTHFATDAAAAGYTVHDGIPMLMHQAIAQSTLFTGKKPNADVVNRIQHFLTSPLQS